MVTKRLAMLKEMKGGGGGINKFGVSFNVGHLNVSYMGGKHNICHPCTMGASNISGPTIFPFCSPLKALFSSLRQR